MIRQSLTTPTVLMIGTIRSMGERSDSPAHSWSHSSSSRCQTPRSSCLDTKARKLREKERITAAKKAPDSFFSVTPVKWMILCVKNTFHVPLGTLTFGRFLSAASHRSPTLPCFLQALRAKLSGCRGCLTQIRPLKNNKSATSKDNK